MISKARETLLKVPVPLAAKHSNKGTGFFVVGTILFHGVYFPFLHNS